jgi:hypothetical protein
MTFDEILKNIHDCKPDQIVVIKDEHEMLMKAAGNNTEFCDIVDDTLIICGVPILVKGKR